MSLDLILTLRAPLLPNLPPLSCFLTKLNTHLGMRKKVYFITFLFFFVARAECFEKHKHCS